MNKYLNDEQIEVLTQSLYSASGNLVYKNAIIGWQNIKRILGNKDNSAAARRKLQRDIPIYRYDHTTVWCTVEAIKKYMETHPKPKEMPEYHRRNISIGQKLRYAKNTSKPS